MANGYAGAQRATEVERFLVVRIGGARPTRGLNSERNDEFVPNGAAHAGGPSSGDWAVVAP